MNHSFTSHKGTPWIAAALFAGLLAACGGGDDGDTHGDGAGGRSHEEDGASAKSATPASAPQDDPQVGALGFVLTPSTWAQTEIPVCWVNPTASDTTERQWVRAAVQDSWSRYSRVQFTGWGTCPAVNQRDAIRIRNEDTRSYVLGLGKESVLQDAGMVLNLSYVNYEPYCAGELKQSCIRFTAMHEFGHALGFAHEQNRPDTPSTCPHAPIGTTGDLSLGAWDPYSIMNYCNEFALRGIRPTDLSTGDIEMVQKFYGARAGLNVDYFANPNLLGPPVLSRIEAPMAYWGEDSPAPGVPRDNFSARWSGFIHAPQTGTYAMETFSDDGVRLWIDGRLVIDHWAPHSLAAHRSEPLPLTAGPHAIVLEYRELTGAAAINLVWRPPGQEFNQQVNATDLSPNASGRGLTGTYFRNPDLQGAPALTRREPVNFQWPAAPLGTDLPRDGFSVRWSGQVEAPTSGAYTLQTLSDDGVRVWIDDALVISNWTPHGPSFDTTRTLQWKAGELHAIRIEYQELSGPGTAQLRWRGPEQTDFTVVPMAHLYPASWGTGLRGQYFANPTLQGAPVLSRTEAVDFRWEGRPAAELPADNFSVRWSGSIEAAVSGLHTLQTLSDDGVRVWVDGRLVIDNWTAHAPVTNTSAAMPWVAGERHAIAIEYQETGGSGTARLSWRTPQSSEFRTVPLTQLYPAEPGPPSR